MSYTMVAHTQNRKFDEWRQQLAKSEASAVSYLRAMAQGDADEYVGAVVSYPLIVSKYVARAAILKRWSGGTISTKISGCEKENNFP